MTVWLTGSETLPTIACESVGIFRRWRDRGLIREFHDRVRGQVRGRAGHDALPTAGVIDSQSVKTDAVVGAGIRGFDGGKLVNVDCLEPSR
ncbi:hypothetical protein ACFWWA_15300 [Streptomyces goshikiensis]|uniref:hypothetical protein n=1 Tax=Streptomyces goshikiensis TaxID=1942 RepID=UPI0036600433